MRSFIAVFTLWLIFCTANADMLTLATSKDPFYAFPGILKELARKGYIEGEDFRVIRIDLSEAEKKRAEIKQLIESEVDIFLVGGNQFNPLIQTIQPKIPILFIGVKGLHPVPEVMKSYATGLYRTLTIAKVFEQKSRILPYAKRLALLYRNHSGLEKLTGSMQQKAQQLGIALTLAGYDGAEDFDPLFADLQSKVGGVVLFPPSVVSEDLPDLMAAQFKYGLPVLAQVNEHIDAGALGGIALNERYSANKLADYAARIIQGAQISKLPIVFDQARLRINLNTASRLSLDLPQEIVLQADIVSIAKENRDLTYAETLLKPGSYSVAIPEKLVPSFDKSLFQALAERGYQQGKNLTVRRFPCDEKAPAADIILGHGAVVSRLIDHNPGRLVVATSIFHDALQRKMHNQPVHMVFRSSGARLATLVKQIFPMKAVATLVHEDSVLNDSVSYQVMLRVFEEAGMDHVAQDYKATNEIAAIMAAWKKDGVDALLLFPPALATSNDLDVVIRQQNSLKLPVISFNALVVPKGVALGVRVDPTETAQQMAKICDRIWQHGEKSAPKKVYLKPNYLIDLEAINALELVIPKAVISNSDILH